VSCSLLREDNRANTHGGASHQGGRLHSHLAARRWRSAPAAAHDTGEAIKAAWCRSCPPSAPHRRREPRPRASHRPGRHHPRLPDR